MTQHTRNFLYSFQQTVGILSQAEAEAAVATALRVKTSKQTSRGKATKT